MNNDQINEHYYGDPANPTTERARERIHWMCRQATGSDILDVGCSQGIVCLILGREGFFCTGIDLESESLAVANDALAKEEEVVRERVNFQVADACAMPFADASFDTVFMGEILEHLTHPAKILSEAKRVLRKNGRLVLTVPFGLNAFPDHKATYYPIALLELLGTLFRLETVETFSNYIVYTGRHEADLRSDFANKPEEFDQLRKMAKAVEARCLEKERSLFELGKKLYAQIKTLNAQSQTQSGKLQELTAELNSKEEIVKRNTDDCHKAEQEVANLREKLTKAELVAANSKAETAGSAATLKFALQELSLARNELEKQTQMLAENREAATRLEVELAGLKVAAAMSEKQHSVEAKRDRATLVSVRKKCAQLTAANSKLTKRVADLDRMHAQLTSEIRGLNETISSRERELATVRTQTTTATMVKQEASLSSQRFAEIQAELETAKLEAETFRQQLETKDEEWRGRLKEIQVRLEKELGATKRELEERNKLYKLRLRERERHLSELVGQREANWKRATVNQRIRDVVRRTVPAEARVLVISKGDDDLLALDGRRGEHFPQAANGLYAGYHPETSNEVIDHLKTLRTGGAQFLLIPTTSLWWLDFYADFATYLKSNSQMIAYEDGTCVIYAFDHSKERTSTHLGTTEGNGKHVESTTRSSRTVASEKNGSIVSVAKCSDRRSNGNGAPRSLKLGVILDEFTMGCLKPECSLLTFRPDNWKETLRDQSPDALFVESAWRGNEGAWLYRVANYQRNMGDEISELLEWARKKGIPSIFWNKEDPVHFDRFIGRARLFSQVFTTDADCIPRYREEVGHDHVYALPFAAQPSIHNPIQSVARNGAVCFAGTYYGNRHGERRQDMDYILKPGIPFGLEIYDRQHGVTGKGAADYRFPEIYQSCIRGRLDYDEMVKAYKRYRVFLNVNSVKQSPTMFSRRVFELLASGTPVVSTYSRGIVELLGEDVVYIAETEADTRRHLERLLGDEEEWARASLRGIRKVMGDHTYRRRMQEVAERTGIVAPCTSDPNVSIVIKIPSASAINRLINQLKAQTYSKFDVKLISKVALHESNLDKIRNALPSVEVTAIVESVGDMFSECGKNAGELMVFLNLRDTYGPNYLLDHVQATQYSSADFFGKHTFYKVAAGGKYRLAQTGHEFAYVSSVPASTLMARKSALTRNLFDLAVDQPLFRLDGRKILSTDRFNYAQHNAETSIVDSTAMEEICGTTVISV